MTEHEVHMIKRAAFQSELEKLAGPGSWALRGLTKLFPRFGKGLKDMAALSSTKLVQTPIKGMSAELKNSITADAASQGWLNKRFGVKGLRNMLGTKSKVHSIYEVKKSIPSVKFRDNPLLALKNSGKKVIANQAQNLEHIKNNGLWDFTKQELKNSQYYTRNVTKGDKTYGVKMKRSALGRAVNPLAATGVGFGAFDLATNKIDKYGRKNPMGKRLGSAGLETLKWGVAEPLMGAKMMAYDLPKMGINMVKGF